MSLEDLVASAHLPVDDLVDLLEAAVDDRPTIELWSGAPLLHRDCSARRASRSRVALFESASVYPRPARV